MNYCSHYCNREIDKIIRTTNDFKIHYIFTSGEKYDTCVSSNRLLNKSRSYLADDWDYASRTTGN